MKTILVLAELPDLADAVRGAVDPENYRVLHHSNLEDAEPLLDQGLVAVCVLDVDLTGVQSAWMLEKFRRRAPKCPLVIYTSGRQWEWEEEAYLQGAAHVLTKPVRPRLLTSLLNRLSTPAPPQPAPAAPPPASDTSMLQAAPSPLPGAAQTLALLRDFSGILTHSLDAELMLREFLVLLRRILSVNRAVVFLRSPLGAESAATAPSQTKRLRSAGAIGISPALLRNFELTLDGGIGGLISRLGRILRRSSEEAHNDLEAQKEFEVLGVRVAVPVLDRETVIGVALFDGRVTGEPIVNTELELIFHLLEQLGMAVKNIWLHEQLAGSHEMMAGILRELSSACIVVGRDLSILHANKTARKYFARAERRSGEIEFADLPQALAAKVYQVLKTGSAVPAFKFEPEGAPGTVYNISVVPFQRQPGALPGSALLMAEDLTQSEQLRRLEVEASNLRLVKTMADRLTHEIGNAMVPVSTHQQLLADKWKDAEFRASLDVAMADSVKRVMRLVNQMRFLARDALVQPESFPVGPLVEEAFQEACKYYPAKAAQLRCDNTKRPIVMTGDRAALKHALAEVMLNALQANPADPKIGVRFDFESDGNGMNNLWIEVQDNGSGFTADTAQKAPEPFFTTRNVGLGLGLTASRKIIETHHGKLEIAPPKTGQAGLVRICLPIGLVAAK